MGVLPTAPPRILFLRAAALVSLIDFNSITTLTSPSLSIITPSVFSPLFGFLCSTNRLDDFKLCFAEVLYPNTSSNILARNSD
jgi:hypothetical protein